MEPETDGPAFSYPAEILPKNPRTQEIMAKREQEEAQRRAEAEEVSL